MESRIIVYATFDALIEANLAQTKLAAYGVPCFLTGENLTALTTPILTGGIHLHIFEQDREEVANLLHNQLHMSNDDLICCPNCRSKRILDFSKNDLGPAKVAKVLLQLSKTHYCLDCETEFDN
jgi:hypothetical protein